MKLTNKALFIILCCLTYAAYLLDPASESEFSDVEKEGEKVIPYKTSAYNLVGLGDVEVKRSKGMWLLTNPRYRANHQKIDKMIDRLSNLYSVGEVINKNENLFFQFKSVPLKVSNSRETREFVIGDLIQSTGNFYLKDLKTKKIHIINDQGFIEGFFKNQLEAKYELYSRLLDLLESKHSQLINDLLFYDVILDNLRSIELFEKKKLYTLNVIKNETVPKNPEDVLVLSIRDEMKNFLFSTRIEKVYQHNGKKRLSRRVSSLVLTFLNGHKKTYRLYDQYGTETGKFIQVSEAIVAKLKPDSAEIFQRELQDYWDKSLPPINLESARFSTNDKTYLKLKKFPEKSLILSQDQLTKLLGSDAFSVRTSSRGVYRKRLRSRRKNFIKSSVGRYLLVEISDAVVDLINMETKTTYRIVIPKGRK